MPNGRIMHVNRVLDCNSTMSHAFPLNGFLGLTWIVNWLAAMLPSPDQPFQSVRRHLLQLKMASLQEASKVIVQYIALRRDLLSVKNWPLGALIAQACHASTAAIFGHHQNPIVEEYLKNLDQMHKVVVEVGNLLEE